MRGLSQLIKVVVIISLVFVGIVIAFGVRSWMVPPHGIPFETYAIIMLFILILILLLLVVPILLYLRHRANV